MLRTVVFDHIKNVGRIPSLLALSHCTQTTGQAVTSEDRRNSTCSGLQASYARGICGRLSFLAKDGTRIFLPFRDDTYDARHLKTSGDLPFNCKDDDSIRKVVENDNTSMNLIEWDFCTIFPLKLPLHPSRDRLTISDPLRDHSLIGLVLDLPRFNTTPLLYDGPKTGAKAIILPPLHPEAPEMVAGGGRNLRHRRRSMKKHWRKKHFRRDLVIYRKRERRRKMAAEKVFRDRLSDSIKNAEDFDAKSYVENFLANVQLDKGQQAPPSILMNESSTELGKKVGVASESRKKTKGPYVHWTELITVEQLYGLPPSKFIDVNVGKASGEEWQEILRLRRQYEETFKKKGRKNEDEKEESKNQ